MEGYIQVGGVEGTVRAEARLYYRETGEGQPIIILHGGPSLSHDYLLPELDRLSDAFRLIYYDQRGRGKSAEGVKPEDVSIESEIEDLERVREQFGLEEVAVLGHSWGGLLAMEYAIRYPSRVSHLILMNTAPVSHGDYLLLKEGWKERRPTADAEEMQRVESSAGYQEGDPESEAEYLRSHFRMTVRGEEHLDGLVDRLRSSFTKEGILKGREVAERLVSETWLLGEYDLLPQLARLGMPTLVLHGDYDFIPEECATHVAQAMPNARFVLLGGCGHFSYVECPEEVREEISRLFEGGFAD